MLVATNIVYWQQNVCRDKLTFVATNTCLCVYVRACVPRARARASVSVCVATNRFCCIIGGSCHKYHSDQQQQPEKGR